MASRTLFSNMSSPMPNGLEFLEQYANRLKQLFDAAIWPLTSVGGTGDVVTATLDPALTAGLAENMRFAISWAAANTGGMTLSINGGSAVPVLDVTGAAMVAGSAAAGGRAFLEYVGGSFRVINQLVVGGQNGPVRTVFTASATWTKPTGYADDHPVLVRAWAGGGSGARGANNYGGGGGGAFAEAIFRYADLPSSVSVAVGAGGAGLTGGPGVGMNGGNSTFGALLTAFGGAGGVNTSGGGGGGGGELAAGSGTTGGRIGGGKNPDSTQLAASTLHGGGGGGGTTDGGRAVWGGGGGGGAFAGSQGGASKFGGQGGGIGAAGSVPAGGGGAHYSSDSGSGARGQVEVWL